MLHPFASLSPRFLTAFKLLQRDSHFCVPSVSWQVANWYMPYNEERNWVWKLKLDTWLLFPIFKWENGEAGSLLCILYHNAVLFSINLPLPFLHLLMGVQCCRTDRVGHRLILHNVRAELEEHLGNGQCAVLWICFFKSKDLNAMIPRVLCLKWWHWLVKYRYRLKII